MPAGSPDDAARALAEHVLAGGGDALAALLTALQASGAAVRSPDNRLVVRPADPWHGLIFDSWEIRTMLASVLPERTVSFGLTDVADALRTMVPELGNAPVAQLLAQDVRKLALGPPSTGRFWARFVIELGREPDAPPQLVTEIDPSKIRLNALQASLIVRRVAVDLILRGDAVQEKPVASRLWTPGWTFVEPVYADTLPCTLDSTQRSIMDWTAFAAAFGISVGGLKMGELGPDSIFDALESHGWSGAEKAGKIQGYTSMLLAYVKLFAAYAALEVKISMDSPPLVRTRDMRPQSGERKDLTADVRMNVGNAQMLNCFRIMLNAAGLDFSLPNDGAAKGAQIDWEGVSGFDEAAATLHGGPDQIVRFVGDAGSQYQTGGAFTSFNSITKSVVDDNGKARVKVEGVGQRDRLGQNARKRTKQASVRVNVALQGADLIGDLRDAAGDATAGVKSLVTLPAQVMARSKWISKGHYTFDVTDWSDEGKWSGTVTVTTTRKMTSESHGPTGGGKSEETQALDAQMQVTETVQDASAGDGLVGNMKASINAHYTWTGNSSSTSTGAGCNGQDLAFSGEKWAEGTSGGREVNIVVVVSGGQAHVGVDSIGFQIPYAGSDSRDEQHNDIKSRMTFKGVTRSCTIETSTRTTRIDGTTGIGTIDVAGPVDPKDPDHIHGSSTKTYGGGNDVATQTITWDLRRG